MQLEYCIVDNLVKKSDFNWRELATVAFQDLDGLETGVDVGCRGEGTWFAVVSSVTSYYDSYVIIIHSLLPLHSLSCPRQLNQSSTPSQTPHTSPILLQST